MLAAKKDIPGGNMNDLKLNSLYNFLKNNFLTKESKDLFLLIKNASQNFESAGSKFVYIINYRDAEYSI